MMTPTEIDNDVTKLISVICPNSVPIYLTVEPERYVQVKQCFPAVAEKIRRDGGSQVLGWQIWKSDILVEAEFHAVWKPPEGTLRDITPKQLPISRILFLPDPKATYDGCQVDNIRMNISGNRLVDDFITIAKIVFAIENRGERARQHEFTLSNKEAVLYEALKRMQAEVYLMIQNGMTRNSVCFCGSHDKYKYKHCHGKRLMQLIITA